MYNHLVNIQRRVTMQDPATGAPKTEWQNFKTNVPADIKPVSARAFMQSQVEQSGVTVTIKTPYLAGVDHTMRLVGKCSCHNGKVYNPAGVLEDNITGRQHTTWPCSQGVNQGQ